MKPDDIARSAQQFEPINARQIKRDRAYITIDFLRRQFVRIAVVAFCFAIAWSIVHGEPIRGTKNTLRIFETLRSAE